MSSNTDLLFDYLRDIIYVPDKARLDKDKLDEDFQRLAEGMLFLGRLLKEQRSFVAALSKGDLSVLAPSRENELVAPLKSLQASLRHLTWQTQQVAAGDYHQRVDFMGEFAEAFNQMVVQLDSRQQALMEEIESSHEKSRALEQSNNLLSNITAGIPQSIIVLSAVTGKPLFTNHSAEALISQSEDLLHKLEEPALSGSADAVELSISVTGVNRFYNVNTYSVHWSNEVATAFVLNDISKDKHQMIELEQQAMYDSLTGTKSRYAGMRILSDWLDAERSFTLCFIDLDNLKYINDCFGHSEGDIYIKRVSDLLLAFSEDAAVSRVGGDEFMLLAPDFKEKDALERMAQLQLRLDRSARKDGIEYDMGISYGAVQSSSTLTAGELLSIADERMYRFKRQRKQMRKRK